VGKASAGREGAAQKIAPEIKRQAVRSDAIQVRDVRVMRPFATPAATSKDDNEILGGRPKNLRPGMRAEWNAALPLRAMQIRRGGRWRGHLFDEIGDLTARKCLPTG
jgi:hypothetical protein